MNTQTATNPTAWRTFTACRLPLAALPAETTPDNVAASPLRHSEAS